MRSYSAKRSISVTVGPLEVSVTYAAHYDPGRTYGPPEDCYPPDSDMGIESIEINGEDASAYLSESAMARIEDACWEDFEESRHERECGE